MSRTDFLQHQLLAEVHCHRRIAQDIGQWSDHTADGDQYRSVLAGIDGPHHTASGIFQAYGVCEELGHANAIEKLLAHGGFLRLLKMRRHQNTTHNFYKPYLNDIDRNRPCAAKRDLTSRGQA